MVAEEGSTDPVKLEGAAWRARARASDAAGDSRLAAGQGLVPRTRPLARSHCPSCASKSRSHARAAAAIKLNTAVRSLWLLQYVRSLLLKGPTAERQAEGFQPVADLPDEDLGHDGADGKEEAAAAGERGGGGGPTAEDS